MKILGFAEKHSLAMVIATTGFSDEEEKQIRNAANHIPIFKSDNMSYGVNVVVQLLKLATKLLSNYNIGISEFYHADKVATAKSLLFNAINEAHGNDLTYSYGFKQSNEVCILSSPIITGLEEQIITFATLDEVISVRTTHNSSVYAIGALEAARYLLEFCGCAGYYTMDNMFEDMQDN